MKKIASCLYEAAVFHDRLSPKRHTFGYKVYYFYLDLDEIDELSRRFWPISRNKFNLFSFKDKEHLQLEDGSIAKENSTKDQIVAYLKQNGVNYDGGKLFLLTQLNVLGTNFNPVSFYFIQNKSGETSYCVVEVQNTFREIKPYLLLPTNESNTEFKQRVIKYFYVSPFINHDTAFDFNIHIPNEHLAIGIDDYEGDNKIFISTLTGVRKEITTSRLIYYTLRYPFLPFQVLFFIHWQAFKLWLKKLPFHKKSAFQELQQDVLRKTK